MRNIRLTLQYDGTRYLGWSRPEKDGARRTVSFKIEETLRRLTGGDVTLYAGARTDAHVHALSQTVSFHTDSTLPCDRMCSLLNRYLPRDIAVLHAEEAPERFRADINRLSCTYEYRVCTSRVYDVFASDYEGHCFPSPDLSRMEEASAFLVGRHDFRPFSSGKKKKGTVKDIFDIRFAREPGHIIIQITADDFLRQMPARIAGTLLETGRGLCTPGSIPRIFEGSEKAGAPAEAKGLLLKSIQY